MMSCNAAYGYGSGYAAGMLQSSYNAQMDIYYAGNWHNQHINIAQQERHSLDSTPRPGSFLVRRKKTLCSFFMKGICTKGELCSFTHAYSGTDEAKSQRFQQRESSQGYQHCHATVELTLDDFSDFSDSDDEELLDNPMKSNEFADVRDPVLSRTLSTRSAFEPLMEPMGEPSPSGANEKNRDETSYDEISESELTRTGSQASDGGSVESEPEAEEPLTPYMSLHRSLPGTLSKSFGTSDSAPDTLVKGRTPLKLEVSETSWAAQRHKQSSRAGGASSVHSDEQVARSIKSILNKLTIEKFDSLSKQLVSCGLRSAAHAELLIREIFEKATTQHHFVDMYADLCTFLHKHFTDHPFVVDAANDTNKEDKTISFKRLLLDECQASFEMRSSLSQVDAEDEVAVSSRKTRMLGNIKLVGALLSRDMLAGKVGLAILQEMLCSPTPESLESVALLLTTAGPDLDRPDRSYHASLNHIFARIAELVRGTHCRARERFLLKDLLELRANCWVDHRPKKLERAMTLDQVAKQASGRQQW